jgi:hypothetical protein
MTNRHKMTKGKPPQVFSISSSLILNELNEMKKWRLDTQHNGTQYNGTLLNKLQCVTLNK